MSMLSVVISIKYNIFCEMRMNNNNDNYFKRNAAFLCIYDNAY